MTVPHRLRDIDMTYREIFGNDYWQCYTEAGNALCGELTQALEADILAGTLTPREVASRFKAIISDVRKIDDGMCDSEPYYVVAGVINLACKKAGYAPVVTD